MQEKMSAVLLTKNSAGMLKEVLAALQEFDEVIVYDTGSNDETLSLARSYAHVKIVEGRLDGFGKTKNQAAEQARNDWIFSIDSDEIVSEDLKKELRALKPIRGQVYSMPRKNYYRSKFIWSCGWYPDRQYRLYNRLETAFTPAKVHEKVKLDGLIHVPLSGALLHTSYREARDFLAKMQLYSDLFAEQYKGVRHSSFSRALFHGFAAFFKAYLLKLGLFSGREGFEIAFYNGATAFYKYIKLEEANFR